MNKISVIGTGSWGTALASVLADNHQNVYVWGRNEQTTKEINDFHTNNKYLPGILLSNHIKATSSLRDAIQDSDLIVIVTPSHSMRDMVRQIKKELSGNPLIVHATKGLEIDTCKRMSEVIRDELPSTLHSNICVLSGPSHAEEVIRKLPTTVVIGGSNDSISKKIQNVFFNDYFRVYTNDDMIGMEIGGALKNIIALGAGLADGLGYGDNTKAALLTRGLAEIERFGVYFGANSLTFSGLAGIGDLIVTGTSKHSRNWKTGYMLSQGKTLAQISEEMGMVIEGVRTTKAVYQWASTLNVEMPITEQLYKVLFENKKPQQAIYDLMNRNIKGER